MRSSLFICVLLAMAGTTQANIVGFDEQFALDREKALQQLIPGTEDYYYYTTLNHQHLGELDKAHKVIDQYVKRYRHTGRVHELLNRQALLEYRKNPTQSITRIRDRLSLRFHHQKIRLDKTTQLPSSLDQNTISHETLKAKAYSTHKNLDGFEDAAFDFLFKEDLNPDRRRAFLQRLDRPDYPGLAKLVVDDLTHKHSGGFGSLGIHKKLLLSQLKECLRLKPDLNRDSNFVNSWLERLKPGHDVNWEYDAAIREAYLDRLWKFVNTLPPVHNSLKANVMFERLHFDRAQGVRNADRFMTYVKMPRQVFYMNPVYMKQKHNQQYRVRLGQRHASTLLPPVSNDEPLVRDYLMHFLKDAENTKTYSAYIESNYLKEVFAETKIVNGIGDMESWYSLMPPAKYKQLKDRIDLDFLPDNKQQFKVGDKVSLTLAVKNVETLLVRTYRIHTENYYRENMSAITTAIDLDGLVANTEKTFSYEQPALRRHVENFEFPELDTAGVYVLEFIGNGRSSRALVRMGRFETTERLGSAGHVFQVYDENQKAVKDASIWMAGREYTADENSEITIPYSTRPQRQKYIVSSGEFSVLRTFSHRAENYELDAGMYVDREELIKHKEARLILRPRLLLNGLPVSLSLVEQPAITMVSTDIEGTTTSKVFDNLKLEHGKDMVLTFRVPDKLQSLDFSMSAKVRSLSAGNDVNLGASASFSLNGIDKTTQITDMKLQKAAGTYFLEVSGKSGEPYAGRTVSLSLKHRDFKRRVNISLQTDKSGVITLGALKGIQHVSVSSQGIAGRSWRLLQDGYTHESVRHAAVGDQILVPWMGTEEALFNAASLLEYRNNAYTTDHRDKIALGAGFLIIKDLPAGDFSLFLKDSQTHIRLKVSDAERKGNWLLARDRMLEDSHARPLQILAVDEEKKDTISIRLANADQDTRVHVVVSRYLPEYNLFSHLRGRSLRAPGEVMPVPAIARYLSGRNIGDEYRYILQRRFATRFPGNMLARPSLILNPWSPRKTETRKQDAQGGENYEELAEAEAMQREGAMNKRAAFYGGGGSSRESPSPNFDYLPSTSLVLANLVPDKKGIVSVPAKEFGGRQHLHVIAVNDRTTAYRQVTYTPEAEKFRDLRLAAGLPIDKHYSEQKKIDRLSKGDSFTLKDLSTDKMELYDSLGQIYTLLSTLSSNENLAKFAFILDWPELDEDRRRELYKDHACHELNFYLYKKDPGFFKKVIKPYLANKKDKTFLDDWLLGSKLDKYTKPWAYQRLNTTEQILLAQRLKHEQEQLQRIISDRFDLLTPDMERFNHLFRVALKGRSLDVPGEGGAMMSVTASEDAFLSGSLKPQASMSRYYAASEKGKMSAKKLGKSLEGAVRQLSFAANSPAAPAAVMDNLERVQEVLLKDGDEAKLEERNVKYRVVDTKRRKANQSLYRKLDKTSEWVENNYYKLPITQQLANLVSVNAFWNDYAAHDGKQPFVSTHVADATSTFSEMMFVLSVTDLPLVPAKHKVDYNDASMTVIPGGHGVAFYQEIRETEVAEDARPILLSQGFFAADDRYRYEKNEKIEKFVTKEFEVGRVYGCQVVMTNPTSSRRKIDVLLQIPKGAMPLNSGFYTRSNHVQLNPYSTTAQEFYFYFPGEGDFDHYPVHVAEGEDVVAYEKPFTFKVVEELSERDTTSWQYVSQHGSDDEVLTYLENNNMGRLDLELIAFRMKDKAFFNKALNLLSKRHVYHPVLWSYSIHHNVPERISEYLPHTSFADQCGLAIESPLLTLKPIVRHAYEHKEYWPLVNSRTYQLGEQRRILNQQFHGQYMHFMSVLRYRKDLSAEDKIAVITYLLLQDRVEESLTMFDTLKRADTDMGIQYDYLNAYLAFYRSEPGKAKAIAAKYKDYPVERWRDLFGQILTQAEEIAGGATAVHDENDRDQAQAQLADTAPTIDFTVEDRVIKLSARNLKQVEINYYPMDIELLFSRNPFVKEVSGHFSVIQPNHSSKAMVAADGEMLRLPLPDKFKDSNVMIEIRGKGVVQTQAYYPNSLTVRMMETYGQLQVAHAKTGKPLSKTYVKVFSKDGRGNSRFYKDGYTDLRGRFDYSSLNTSDIDSVQRFSILIMSDEHGSVIREAAPPKM